MVVHELETLALDVSNPEHLNSLQLFKDIAGKSLETFRYFNSRTFEVLKNHLVTLLLLHRNVPIAYGHLDKEDDRVWLGIAVVETKKGMGIGKYLMEKLIQKAQQRHCKEVYLSVDKINISAIHLYEQFGFSILKEISSEVVLMKVELENKFPVSA